MENTEQIPQHCPGTQSENAGKESACAGCPNQNICASGATKGPDPALELIKERLSKVKHKIVVISGKGGVGKSTVAALLAHGLASRNREWEVGVLDADICGPSQPRIFGVSGEQVHHSGSGWSPVYVRDNLCLMSIGFLLSSPDDAVIWRGPKKNGMIKQFLSEVDWGELDYLIIDTPPGTSDEHLSLVQYLSGAGLTGVLVVTTPQEVALLDVRKQVDFCSKVGVRILGVVQNMTTFVCPNCKHEGEVFKTRGGFAAEELGPLAGALPLMAPLARACDEGDAGPHAVAARQIVDFVVAACENQQTS